MPQSAVAVSLMLPEFYELMISSPAPASLPIPATMGDPDP